MTIKLKRKENTKSTTCIVWSNNLYLRISSLWEFFGVWIWCVCFLNIQLDNQFPECSNGEETDIEFSVTIITRVVSVGESTVGSSDCNCRISSGKVTCGTIAFTDKFELLFSDKACWEIVNPEEGDRVDARLVSMPEITVTWTRGSMSPFCVVTWRMCTTGEFESWVPSKVWAIAAGPESK